VGGDIEKKTLNIDIEELCAAKEDTSYENEYYLGLNGGEGVLVSEYMDDEDQETEDLDQIEEKFDRYEQIPRAESHEGYWDMVDFTATLEDERLAELLGVAIDCKGAFRRFKDVLPGYPEEEERWFRFKDDRMEQRASEWLEDIGVTLSEE
jgi:hypothetical protein